MFEIMVREINGSVGSEKNIESEEFARELVIGFMANISTGRTWSEGPKNHWTNIQDSAAITIKEQD